MSAADAAALMDTGAAAEFAAVPAAARLGDCAPGTSLYRAATALYGRYRLTSIGQGRRSKLLHLKRPWLVPIADTRVTAAYRDRSAAWAADLGIAGGRWEAAREDLAAAAGGFGWLTAKLRTRREPAIGRLSRLTPVRLLDILAWTIGAT